MSNALIVIDMQNDYLWEKRKPMFSYDTAELTAMVNKAINRYRDEGARPMRRAIAPAKEDITEMGR